MSRKLIMANPRSGAEIDHLALMVVKRFQPNILKKPSAFEVERFFECDLGEIVEIDTAYRQLSPGIYGYTDSETLECIVSSDLAEDLSQRYFFRSTTAHEAGHTVLHVPEFRLRKELLRSIQDTNHVSLRMYRESDIPLYRNPEWQAWRFAGALLMPEPIIRVAISKGYTIKDISWIFEVNPAFVESRLRALKIGM